MADSIKTRTTAEKLALCWGITFQRVYKLIEEGIIPAPIEGGFEWPEINIHYINYLKRGRNGDNAVSPTLTEERILLTRENRLKVAKINRILDREFFHVPTAEKALIKYIAEINAKLDTLPPKTVPKLALCNTNPQRKEVLEQGIEDIRDALRGLDVSGIITEACERGVEIASKIKPKSVGKPVRVSKRRVKQRGR